jgi:hypothetical protein
LDSCGESGGEEDDDYEDDSWEYCSEDGDGAEDEEGWEYYYYEDTDTGQLEMTKKIINKSAGSAFIPSSL